MLASEIRRKRAGSLRVIPRWGWHLDEVFVRTNGERDFLWRAVNHVGEVLEVFATKRWDRKAALAFIKRTMKRYGRSQYIVTDRLPSWNRFSRIRRSDLSVDSHLCDAPCPSLGLGSAPRVAHSVPSAAFKARPGSRL